MVDESAAAVRSSLHSAQKILAHYLAFKENPLLFNTSQTCIFGLLEEMGVKIIVGKNGKEGIEKLEANKSDLILTDIMMPEMNGYEAMPGDREKCIESGANDYLTKPINPDKLISMLRVWLYQ